MKTKNPVTVTSLSAETGVDRHRIRQALHDLDPVRTKGSVRFYDRSEALQALERIGTRRTDGPMLNPFRVVANCGVHAAFRFLSEDPCGFAALLYVGKDLGVDPVTLEKLLVHQWNVAAIRVETFFENEWIDLAFEPGGLDSLHRHVFHREPLKGGGQIPNLEVPALINELAVKHWGPPKK
jgi:hypothetical protein